MGKRKVIAYERVYPHGYNKPCEKREIARGVFHCWAASYDEYENGPGNFTAAIIELPDGTIMTRLPEDIQFIVDIDRREENGHTD